MRIIIAGSRTIDQAGFDRAICQCPWLNETKLIVSARARGVDQLAEAWATTRGLPMIRYNPDWKQFGRGAGLLRNRAMVENADALFAIWDGHSRGTKHVIQYAQDQRLRVAVFSLEPVKDGPIHV